ncbi:hypothetical protein BD310DRAFT_806247, partial [Dichomitus squalens]
SVGTHDDFDHHTLVSSGETAHANGVYDREMTALRKVPSLAANDTVIEAYLTRNSDTPTPPSARRHQ